MSIYSPRLVLFDYDQPKTTTTPEERAQYKYRRRTRRLRELVETLDKIVRRSRP
mgnify:CR=1 FL=1